MLPPIPDRSMQASRPMSRRFSPSDARLSLHHHSRRNAGMVGAGQPQSQVSAHAVPRTTTVHLRLVEHVAHVQAANHGWRRMSVKIGGVLSGDGVSTRKSFSRTQYSAQRVSIALGS